MAVDQTLQIKDLLAQSQIRTMKKDLKKLREADVVEESQKISDLNIPKKTEPKKVAIKTAIPATPTPPVPPVQKMQVAPKTQVPPPKANTSEEEKQQIFLIEKQKEDFKNQLQILVKSKEDIATKRRAAEAKKNDWQAKLNPLIDKENKATDDQRESIEKQRWPIEQELTNLEKTIKDLDAEYRNIEEKEIQLRANMVEVDTSLDDIYTIAKSREVSMPEAPKAPQPVVPKPAAPIPPKPVHKPTTTPEQQIEKLKETVQASAKVENVQRKKFLEDIEAWANSDKK